MLNKYIKNIDRERKAYLVVSTLFLIVVLIALYLFYENHIARVAVQPRAVLSVETYAHFPETDAGIVELTEGTELKQTLKMVSTEFDGISIFVNNSDGKSTGIVKLSLQKQDGQIVQSWMYDISQFPYEGFINLYLDELEKVDVGDIYVLKMISENTEDTAIKLQQVLGEEEAGVLSVNGDERQNISLSYRINNGNCNALKYFFVIVSAGIVLGIILISILVVKKVKIEKVAFCLVVILGSLYMLVIPPYVTPDEQSHIVTAYAQSSAILGEDVIDDEGKVIGNEDMNSYSVRREIPNANSYVQYVRWLFGKTEPIIEGGAVELRPPLNMMQFGYMPQVVGMIVGRLLGVNSIQLLFLGRACALFLFAIVMYLCVKMIPFGKVTMLLIGILPMTIQQAASFSYDSVLNGVLFLMIAYIFYLIYAKEKVCWKDVMVLIGLCVIVIPTKFIYVALAALGLLIPKEKFGGNKNKVMAATAIIFSSIAVIIVTNIGRIISVWDTAEKSRADSAPDLAYYTVSYAVSHPLETMEVFFNTITRDVSYYVETIIGQHLGWLDINIESIIILGFIILLLLSILQREGQIQVKTKEKYILSGVVVIVCLLVLCSLLLAETYIGSETILGVQGRYFLPVLPLILFLMQNRVIILKKSLANFLIFGGVFLNIAAVINVMSVVINR